MIAIPLIFRYLEGRFLISRIRRGTAQIDDLSDLIGLDWRPEVVGRGVVQEIGDF
jgi:hypothetical protein